MRPELRTILDELKCRLEAIHGDRLVRMVLYGSQARGDAEPDSDIDVLVVLEGRVPSSDEMRGPEDPSAELSLEHDVVIQCICISRDEYGRGGSPLVLSVRREGVLV